MKLGSGSFATVSCTQSAQFWDWFQYERFTKMLISVCADFELCNESETADSTSVCATEQAGLFPRNSVWGKLRLERKLTSSVLLGSLASWHSTGRRLRLCLWVPCRSTRLWRRQVRHGNKQEEDYGIIMGTLWAIIHGYTGLRDHS